MIARRATRALLVICLLLCAISAMACAMSERAQRRGEPGQARRLTHGGLERSYRLALPDPLPQGPLPLVLVLHGGGGTAERTERYTGFNRLAQRDGFAVVYPQGVQKSWNDGREDPHISAQVRQIDDVGFLEAVIEAVAQEIELDRRRVYMTGISNGAAMTYRFACERAERVAAIGPVINAMPAKIGPTCSPAAAVALYSVQGTQDELVPYDGGAVMVMGQARGEVWSAARTVSHFVARNGCQPDATKVERLDADPDDGVHIELTRWSQGCAQGAQVVHARVEGGGHTWPGAPGSLPEVVVGATSQDADLTELLWAFFSQHQR